MKGEGPLKGPIPDSHCYVVHGRLFHQVMHLRIYNLVISQSQSPPEEHTLSEEKPARLTPSTWRIWSPNLRPPSAAGDPLVTRQTNTPAQKTCNLKNSDNIMESIKKINILIDKDVKYYIPKISNEVKKSLKLINEN